MEVYAADWVLPIDRAPIERGAVAVENGRIVAVAEAAELDGERHEFEECAIIPGFVNAHTHLEYAVYAGLGDGLEFLQWLSLHVERKRRLSFEDMLAVARTGAADCLTSGITTVGDASFSGAAALAAAELGLRAVVYLEVFGEGAEEIESRFARNRARIEHVLSDQVRLGISPHAPLTAGLALYEAAVDLGLPIATHVAESEAELEWLVRGSGPIAPFGASLPPPAGDTGIRVLARGGLLGPWLCAIHCVTVDEEEITLLAERDVAVVHCPRSNALLGLGIAPLAELREARLRIGLGTDSPNSAQSFDMFDEMRAAITLARARNARPDALTAAEALHLATRGSAEALGLGAEIGSLAPGKRADLTVVSLAGSPYLPWEDPAVAVVFGGAPGRVCRTIVDGVTRYSRGGSEWHELRRTAAVARARLLAPSGK